MSEKFQETAESEHSLVSERHQQVKAFLERLADRAEAERLAAWSLPQGMSLREYPEHTAKLRHRLSDMISYPPRGTSVEATVNVTEIGKDDDGTFYRVTVPLFEEGLDAYGLLIKPANPSRCLAVAIHGGGGTPELAAGLLQESNYNDMGRKLARRGHIVWMPACYERAGWTEESSTEPVHDVLEMKSRLVGTTLSALDAYSIIRSTQAVQAREYTSADPVVVAGLSYGGFRTLLVMALSEVFSVGISSCYFNDRRKILESQIPKRVFFDWCFDDVLRTLTDVEMCRLICPRPLCIEVGLNDELFPADGALRSHPAVKELYDSLGVGERFMFDAFDGGHEFSGAKSFQFLDMLGY